MSKMKLAVVTLLFAFVAAWTQPAHASVLAENYVSASHSATRSGLELYLYGSGTNKQADFAAGSHSATANNAGLLELDFAATFADWWDADFGHRQCFTVKSADTEVEYPLRFVVDTSSVATTGADIRVVEGTNGALLTSYSEGPFPSSTSVVWAQAEPLPSGVSDYCVYFDNPTAVNVSDEIGTFTYTAGQTIEHYTLSDRHFGTGVDSNVTVVSYSDANKVSDGTTTVTLNTGQFHTFSNLTQHSVITSTGPIEGNYGRDGRETLVPEGYADAQFSFPTRRYVERFWVRSPHGTTTVEAVANGVVLGSVVVSPASGSVVLDAPGPGNQPVSLRTTNGLDIVALHIGTNRQDSMIGVPWFGDTLYGVASQNLNFGAIVPTSVSYIRHDGVAVGAQSVATSALTVVGGNGSYGNGRAVAASGSTYFHAAQQADRDGTEVTSFLPERVLGQTYRLPLESRYFSLACPTPGTMVSINGGAAAACNGIGVGFFYSGFGAQAAGTLIEADRPVFVYYETRATRDETNLLGPKSNIPYTTEVKMAAGVVEDRALCGSWESGIIPTAGVHGVVSLAAAVPSGTSATFQMSTDGSAFYGSDGTSATSFVDGDIAPYLADGATTLQLKVELCSPDGSSTPSIKGFAVECDLAILEVDVSNSGSLALLSPAAGTDEPILRVYQREAGGWAGHLAYRSGTNLPVSFAQLYTDHPTTQITNGNGTITASSPSFSHATGEPYTVFLFHQTSSGAMSTLDFAVVGDDGVRLEAGVSLNLQG